MEGLYPPGPDVATDELTAPGPTYKKRARVALLSLLLFIVLYLSLTAWFGWTAYKYFMEGMASSQDQFINFGLALGSAFLTLFLVKALFFVNKGGEVNDLEITREEQPEFFEFLNRLADEAGAPRPHRVFLSGRVNAAVFYDLTFLNLLFPSKKNLEVGLALVNGLNLGEFKAVLAHEFGHFRQGSMAVGRWVYVAQQVASHLVYQRDMLDRFLIGLSGFDFRIAWVGWILRLIVWSLRAILDTAFSLVVLAQRSLSREMEFHADMVSVSLTGSDALVHALHRLGAADDAWSRALNVASQELQDGRAVSDIFVVQKIITERMKTILDDENYDKPPTLPDFEREKHRVFADEKAHPPQMWSTHPPNRDREENAKKQYISARIDERSAWEVFRDPQALRERMTVHLLGGATTDQNVARSELTETVANVNKMYAKALFDGRYRGCYLGRSVVREFATATDAIDPPNLATPLPEQFAALYPEALTDQNEDWRSLEEERMTLRALRDGHLEPPDGVIRHRGKIIRKKDLPEAIEEVDNECIDARQVLSDHDRRVRGVHNQAAGTLSDGWQAFHRGLVELLHYADHSAADVGDVHGRLVNLWNVVMADGKVSSGEIKQLLVVAEDMHGVLQSVANSIDSVDLSDTIRRRMNVTSWKEALGEPFGLPAPNRDNLGEWLQAAEGWCGYYQSMLSRLQEEVVQELLEVESTIQNAVTSGAAPGEAPSAPRVGSEYPTLMPGSERKLQRRLGLWDRFQTADGFLPGLARFAVAFVIVGGLLGAGFYFSSSADILIYNGLDRHVRVEAGGDTAEVAPMRFGELTVETSGSLNVRTYTTNDQLVESIDVNASMSSGDYVYNVAGAEPLIRWTAVYGSSSERPPQYLGDRKWIRADVDHLFEEPPESIDTSGSGGRRTVLGRFDDFDPAFLRSYFEEGDSTDDVVRAHALWDTAGSQHLLTWLGIASTFPDFDQIAMHRLQENDRDVMTHRFVQDMADERGELEAVCAEHNAKLAENPGDSMWVYLTTRCMPNGPEQNAAFLRAAVDYPENPWLTGAAGYTYVEQNQWDAALGAFESAYESLPSMRSTYVDQIARVRRMAYGLDTDYSDMAAHSQRLEMIAMIESDDPNMSPFLLAWQRLAQGDLDGALQAAEDSGGVSPELLRLVAASDGASAEQIAMASSLTMEEGIDQETIWVATGFAMRHGLPTDELLAKGDEILYSRKDVFREFAAAIGDRAAAERALSGSHAIERGYAYAMGVVALGDRAPEEWREGAKRLLFAPERPYFE